MSSKERIEQLLKILGIEEKQIRDQIVHLNGQLLYNQKIQKIFPQNLQEISGPIKKTKKTKK